MQPSLEQVKEYYKNAIEIKSNTTNDKFTIDGNYHEYYGDIFCTDTNGVDRQLWSLRYGFAIITKHKPVTAGKHYGDRPDVIDFNNKYNLSFTLGSAVKYIARAGKKDGETKEVDLNKAIECIKRELEQSQELEVGKWYKHLDCHNNIIFIKNIDGIYLDCCGFDFKSEWLDLGKRRKQGEYELATDKEVEDAIIKEAKIRYDFQDEIIPIQDDLNNGVLNLKRIGSSFEFKNGVLYTLGFGRWAIYSNGKWADHV